MGHQGTALALQDSEMKNLLIVSPHFPPVNAPDMHRARTALPYLLDLGWKATVLCVDPRDVAAPRDERLADSIPGEIRIERCRAWPLNITRWVGMRTLSWRAWLSLNRSGCRLIREIRPDLIFFTTTQFQLVSLGPRWKRSFGVPFVVDIQDPWVTDYYSRSGAPHPPGGWKYKVAHAVAAYLEPRTFEPAAGFVSVSPAYLNDLVARYPWFSSKPTTVIPFGVDDREFASAIATEQPAFERMPGRLHLVSVGAAGPIMAASLTVLFQQLRALRDRVPEVAASLQMHFIGTSYAPAGAAKLSVKPIAIGFGVGDLVFESTGRIPWYVAQATMHAADGLILLGSDDSGYTPSRLAGCFMAAKPCLIVALNDSGASRLNGELGLGVQLDPSGTTPNALGDFVADIQNPSPQWPTRRAEELFRKQFTALARTKALAAFLEIAVSSAANS